MRPWLWDNSYAPGEASFYSNGELTLTVPAGWAGGMDSIADTPFTRYTVMPPPSPPPSPQPPPSPPPQSQSHYEYHATPLSHTAAQAVCAARGWRGHLVSIANATENQYIIDNLCGASNCWIGLYKKNTSGVMTYEWYNEARGVVENKHSIDVECPPPPPPCV